MPADFEYSHFDTYRDAPRVQLPAWRERVGHLLDVPISRRQLADGFRGSIDSYRVGGMAFMDCRTDPITQTRPLARISTDNLRQFVFHVAVDGLFETSTGLYPKRDALQTRPGILALDLNQPMRMVRGPCHMLALFVPRDMIEAVLPEAESIHGSVIEYQTPLGRMIPAHLAELCRRLPTMNPLEAEQAIRTCALLIAAAFGRQNGLTGNARAAARTAMFASARRYIDANLGLPDLTVDSVLAISQLSRPTLYRLFEPEGGLAAYIRNRRLREAADELCRYPHKPVIDVAYGWGFNSASDFNRAFRRAYEMSPGDFRAAASAMTATRNQRR
ncbi:helix-turn-helix domain-containing protein [Paraburkholderia sp. G-4-1-8]|uniref:Helix-turn-helix domain-containing protein n=2 Tax=Paraburkholderia antibiotica TaxID=2728839 RepID=A0A7X9ZXR8_9BURK|nr:helix-turn-helix domain-containing protein [Paraburkholderia antibiotica]